MGILYFGDSRDLGEILILDVYYHISRLPYEYQLPLRLIIYGSLTRA